MVHKYRALHYFDTTFIPCYMSMRWDQVIKFSYTAELHSIFLYSSVLDTKTYTCTKPFLTSESDMYNSAIVLPLEMLLHLSIVILKVILFCIYSYSTDVENFAWITFELRSFQLSSFEFIIQRAFYDHLIEFKSNESENTLIFHGRNGR